MPTNTTNLSLKKPIVGADEDLWGGYINDNLDDLDNYLSGNTAIPALDVTGDLTVDANTLYVDSTNDRVGINTSSPDEALHISGSTNPTLRIENTSTSLFGGNVIGSIEFEGNDTDAAGVTGIIKSVSEGSTGTSAIVFDTGSGGSTSEAMRINSAGDIGIGTSSPSNRLTVRSADNSSTTDIVKFETANATAGFKFGYDRIEQINALSPMTFYTGGSEAARIDVSGNLMVGTTVSGGTGGLTIKKTSLTSNCVFNRPYTTSNSFPIEFRNNTSLIGYIAYNSNAVSYVTSSDYRLKEDVQSMVGASDRVLALKPCNFAWKADGTRVDGFLAHEAQEVVPEAVTGTKDAMMTEEYEVTPAVYEDVIIPAVLDDEGNEIEPERTEQRLVTEAVMGTREVPDYQGIDQSKLVPLLTAALQEALTEIADLKARVTALETA